MIVEELRARAAALTMPGAWIEWLLLLASLGLSWLVVRAIRGRRPPEASIWFGVRVVDGVLFAVVSLALCYAGLRGLQLAMPGSPAPVFHIAMPVLLTMLIVRLSVRVLGATFKHAEWVRALERTIAWVAWTAVLLWLTGILPALLEGAESVQLSLGSSRVSLRSLIEGSLSAALVIVVALWISSVIERQLIHGTGNDLSIRKMAANLVRALLLTAGLLIALSAAGIDLTALSVLGGALGVGLGFGLQRIAANYVGGFVMLAERTVRVGDTVKVDGFEGKVNDIRARYTVLRAVTGRESIVPNEMFVSQRVENLSFTDTRVLVQSFVTVAYDTDVAALRDKLCAVMAAVPRVLPDPGPVVQLAAFGSLGIDLALNFWIADPENGQGNVRSDLNYAVLALLRAEGVEIARQTLPEAAPAGADAGAVPAFPAPPR